MKIYHTETREDYDALMSELENRGITWWTGKKATKCDIWHRFKNLTCVKVGENIDGYCYEEFYKVGFSDVPIIKYKAKECAKVEYVIEFGEYFYKKSCNDNDGSRTIIVTSKVKGAYWFSCKENAIEVSKLVGGVVKELTTRVTEVLE